MTLAEESKMIKTYCFRLLENKFSNEKEEWTQNEHEQQVTSKSEKGLIT